MKHGEKWRPISLRRGLVFWRVWYQPVRDKPFKPLKRSRSVMLSGANISDFLLSAAGIIPETLRLAQNGNALICFLAI